MCGSVAKASYIQAVGHVFDPSGHSRCIALCVIHNSLCLQIYLNLSQPSDLIRAAIETIEAKFNLYNTRIVRR